ncbi:MAG: glycosyltransferase family 39 protein, partial [Anaerolineae bacterium]|nr:glycosyltransferase family 39 protein [Anaerolineae bacterium]
SYSFALALEHYSLQLQQPQPPGFPVYVALARMLYALRPDPVLALTLLSAICGAVSVWLIYQLGRVWEPRSRFPGLYAALLFAVIPVSWLTSDKALSDMPGLAATLLSLLLWVRWRQGCHREAPYAAAVVTGLSLGVRPHNILPVVLCAGAYLVQDIVHGRARPLRSTLLLWLRAGGAGLVGVLVWLIPTAAISGGFRTYLALVSAHAGHVGRADALFGMGEPVARALWSRLIAFADTGLISLAGMGLYGQKIGTTWRHIAWGLFAVPGLLGAGWRRRQTRRLAVWWSAVALQILAFEALDRPRLLLPLLPPLVLLIAAGWARIARPRWLRAIVLSVSFLAILLQTVPLVTQLSQEQAPPAQATAYIAAHYPAGRTWVAAAGSFRAAQVALPNYPLIYLYTFDPGAVADRLASGPTYVAILDRDQFTSDALDVLPRGNTLVTVEDRLFSRDRNVHTQHDQVRLQVLAPPELVPLEALRLPTNGCVDLGSGEEGRYLGPGWFRPEQVGGTTARWAGGEPIAVLRMLLDPVPGQILRFRALAYPPEQVVTVILDGQGLGTFALTETWTETDVALPRDLAAQGEATVVELAHRAIQSPYATTGGTSSDRRELAAAYDWICVGLPQETSPED